MTTKRLDAGRWLRHNWLELLLLAVLLIAIAWLATQGRAIWQQMRPEPAPTLIPTRPVDQAGGAVFDGERAAGVVSFLAALGPRVAGSEASAVTAERIEQELRDNGWQVTVQEFELDGVTRRNIVGSTGAGPVILVGAHYDSSPAADLDPAEANRQTPSPGANDGGSGTAVLLELARTVDKQRLDGEVWLAFFDGQYRSSGEPEAAGVQAWAAQAPPVGDLRAVILMDLLGGIRQQFAIDAASDPALSQQLWSLAAQLGYGGWFIPEVQAGSLNLGQTALASLGGPVAVMAGSDYPYWRTLQDTPEQVDPQGLGRVGRTLQAFLETPPSAP
jgi:glutaminyl-peptide cyclotransferase